MSLMRSLTGLAAAAAVLAICTTVAVADTTIEFVQWWEPELPAGALRGIIDSFEAANPGIKRLRRRAHLICCKRGKAVRRD